MTTTTTTIVDDQRALQFVPLATFVDSGFWAELSRRKLDQWQLDESPKPCIGSFVNYDRIGTPSRLSIDYNAFSDEPTELGYGQCRLIGHVLVTNTIDDFIRLDRKLLMNRYANEIWQEVIRDFWLNDPSVLNRFLITIFADLKKFHYHYWTCIPALSFPNELYQLSPPTRCTDTELLQQCIVYSRQQAYAFLVLQSDDGSRETVPLHRLGDEQSSERCTLVFADPSTEPMHPGWPLRNLLAAVAFRRKQWNRLRVICLRITFADGCSDASSSLELNVGWNNDYSSLSAASCPKAVGWEKDSNGELAARFVDMSATMDSAKIVANAVDLNLKLMRWRLVPDMDVDRFKAVRCLLFGAGTLGCNVARCLLAWGVQHITLVDNATVSYSNPVRQSLFVHDDALNGGKSKALAAADALKRIMPSVNAIGIPITVPMPGHVIPSNEETSVRATLEQLEELVHKHDAIFLLMDSREGRWLPSLLAAVSSKMTFSVALGFDSYVIVRHGVLPPSETAISSVPQQPSSSSASIPGDQLGCYFCCDVTAPGNSSQDRTLDQQCTVSRPGVCMMAAGAAVELFSSVIQHPLNSQAPAYFDVDHEGDGCLGATPHQIRGYVSRFQQMTPAVRRFEKCVACGDAVRAAYIQRRWSFVRDSINRPLGLETISGLDLLHETASGLDLWEFDDNESVKSLNS